jgi:tripartite-type tricarboxylate transporter receptor subunit TctC
MANIPTTAEAGLPGFTVQPWFGIYMSGKTPAALQRQVIDAVAHLAPLARVTGERPLRDAPR